MSERPKPSGIINQLYHETQNYLTQSFDKAMDLMRPVQAEENPANSPKNTDHFLSETKKSFLDAAQTVLSRSPAPFKAFFSTQKPDQKEFAPAVIDLISEKASGIHQGLQIFTQSEDEEDIVYGATIFVETALTLGLIGAVAAFDHIGQALRRRRFASNFHRLQNDFFQPLQTLAYNQNDHEQTILAANYTRSYLVDILGKETFNKILSPEIYDQIKKRIEGGENAELISLAHEIGVVDAIERALEQAEMKIPTALIEILASNILAWFERDFFIEKLLLDNEYTWPQVIEQLAAASEKGLRFEHSLHVSLLNSFERNYLSHPAIKNRNDLGMLWAYLRGNDSAIPEDIKQAMPKEGKTFQVLAEALEIRQQSKESARHDLNTYAAMANISATALISALSQPNADSDVLYDIPLAEWRALAAIVQEAKADLTACLKGEGKIKALIQSLKILQKDSSYLALARGDIDPEKFLEELAMIAREFGIDNAIIESGIPHLRPQAETIYSIAQSIKRSQEKPSIKDYIDIFLGMQQLRGPLSLDLVIDLVEATLGSRPEYMTPIDLRTYFPHFPRDLVLASQEHMDDLRALAQAAAHIYLFDEFKQSPNIYFDRIAIFYNHRPDQDLPLNDILKGPKEKNFYRTEFPREVAAAFVALERIRASEPEAVKKLEATIANLRPDFKLEAGNIAEAIPDMVEAYQRQTLQGLSTGQTIGNPRAFLAVIGRLQGIKYDPDGTYFRLRGMYEDLTKSYHDFYESFQNKVIPRYTKAVQAQLRNALPRPGSPDSDTLVNFARAELIANEFTTLHIAHYTNFRDHKYLLAHCAHHFAMLSYGGPIPEDESEAYQTAMLQKILQSLAETSFDNTDMQLEFSFGAHHRSLSISPEHFRVLQREAIKILERMPSNSTHSLPAQTVSPMRFTRFGTRR